MIRLPFSEFRKILTILDNHIKLLAMIKAENLPIKSVLVDDVEQIRHLLNKGRNKKHDGSIDESVSS